MSQRSRRSLAFAAALVVAGAAACDGGNVSNPTPHPGQEHPPTLFDDYVIDAESPNAPRAQRREVEAAVTALHARVGEVRLAVAIAGRAFSIVGAPRLT